jgi:two-component system response regulator AtoC
MSVPSPRTERAEVCALLVGVEDGASKGLAAPLRAHGLDVRRVASSGQARAVLESQSVAVVIAGTAEPKAIAELCELSLDVPVIGISSDPDIADALRAGCVAVFAPSLPEVDVRLGLERALGRRENSTLEEPPPVPRKAGLLGDSEAIQRVKDLVARTAPVIATALVRGETGTGKEVVARALHAESPRRDGPFIKVHCAALPDALLESELFGYEKGAFTGATARKPGRVELAEGGTLFLDEIGDISAAVQVKLLRLLQDREYERLGGVTSLRADVRFVAATHRNLEAMVKSGDFREDLFYRLNVVTLWLPPLRARRDDIPLLAREFCAEFARAYGKPNVELDSDALQLLRSERWPGNVRQLQNLVERLVVLASGTITAADVRSEMTEQAQFKTQVTAPPQPPPSPAATPDAKDAPPSVALPLNEVMRDAEKAALERALRQAGGNRTVAARILAISRATLYAKMAEHGLA